MTIEQAETAAQEALEHLQEAEKTADDASRFLEDAKQELREAHTRRTAALKVLQDARLAPSREAEAASLTARLNASLEAAEAGVRGWNRPPSPTLQEVKQSLNRLDELTDPEERIKVLRELIKQTHDYKTLDRQTYINGTTRRFYAEEQEARRR
jgi:hypothetical protein